jgi:oxygen-independent coproporphyrinogen-3 oxidase
MAGIYIHIPFCKQACHYCDFHFSTSLKRKTEFMEALLKEIEGRKDYLGTEVIQTIYFGGGTPSLLTGEELSLIFEKLGSCFVIAPDAEITLEANPDDLNSEKLEILAQSSINRLSIGIQSFRDADLKLMNRAHCGEEALTCVRMAKSLGFSNITIDLIYGIPGLSAEDLKANLHTAFELDIQHISSYCLTVEPRTAWARFVKDKLIPQVDDENSSEQFRILKEEMNLNDFVHYEISNFGRKGFFSKHNSNYWKGEHYLGLGPSAHSFNGHSRHWSISNNNGYIESIRKGIFPLESEELSLLQKYNEYIMVSLRTIWGCDLEFIQENFGFKMRKYCLEESEFYLNSGKLVRKGNLLVLSEEGMLIADRISADLFGSE